MKNEEFAALLEKYRNHTASEAERALLESWYLVQKTDALNELSPQQFGQDLLLIGQGLPLQATVRKLRPWRTIAAVAAAVLVLFATYLLWPAGQAGPGKDSLTALNVPAGQRTRLSLSDGSTVWVNAGSTLNYPGTFSGTTREVYLSGEAYFDIHHDAARPFKIHTGKVTTTVLGTAFNILEDKVRHLIAVTVTRGKVSVASGSKVLGIITPNQQLSFNTQSQLSSKQQVDADRVTAWRKIDLEFQDVTFAQAAQRLQERFGVRINFAGDQFRNCRFTGASMSGDSLEEVLKTICDFNHASYQKMPDGSILITGEGCKP